MKGVFKNIEFDNIENIINVFELKKDDILEKSGEIYSLQEIKNKRNNFEIADFIGKGYLIYDEQIVKNSESWLFCESFKIGKEYIISFNKLNEIFKEKIKVLWIKKKGF